MKLITAIILVGCLQVSAKVNAQQIDINEQRVSLKEVFRQIEQQSDYFFIYRSEWLRHIKKINVTLNNAGIREAMNVILNGQPLTYRIVDNNIVIRKVKEHQPSEQTVIQQLSYIQLNGIVVDSITGAPLTGVTVKVSHTNLGTTTDANGHFSLSVPEDAVLEVSYLGYASKIIPINGRSNIRIMLSATTTGLNQLVVVGYGKQRKEKITGAISSVDAETIAERDYVSVSQALQGTAPGLMIRRNSGNPGSGASIRIRGITTIGNSSPLIIVDGIPMSNIDDINPNNIANISILKDAASAAIYGSRAAAGVILITTKRGKKGELNVEFGFEYGIETPTETPEYAGPVQYMKMANESRWNETGNPPDGKHPIYAENVIKNYYELNEKDPDKYPIVDNQDLMIRDYAPKQRYNLSLSGGSENVQTRGTFSFVNIEGLFKHRNYKKMNVRLNNDITLIGGLMSAKVDLYFNRGIQQKPFLANPIYWARMTAPIYAVRYTNGKLASGKTGDNYYGKLLKGGWRHHYANKLRGRLELNIRPLKGLELTGRFGPELHFAKQKRFKKQIPYYSPGRHPKVVGYLKNFEFTDLFLDRSNNYKYTIQLLARYNKDFKRNSLGIMVGYEEYRSFTENMGASRQHFKLKEFPYLSMGPLEFRDNYENAEGNAYRSYFGRINYDYKNRYLLQGAIRFDGSSRFAPNFRWGAFPSISAGWVLSEESFMKGVNPISYFKVRASYGKLGNERIGLYPYQSALSFGNALFYQGSNVVSALTAAQRKWNIPDITWETTTTYNIGLDINLFKNKLWFTGDYYRKYTKNMLLSLEIPDYLGYNNPDQNAGKMYTKGWGVQLTWHDNIGKVRYSVSANLSDYRSIMGDLSGTQFKSNTITAEGTLYQEWYGYKSDGIFQTQQQVNSTAVTSKTVGPGDIKYIDISGPKGKPDDKISPAYDRVPLGGSLPRYLYGGQLQMGYKNFDFSLQIQGVGKKIARMSGIMIEPLGTYWHNIPKLIVNNYWSYYNNDKKNKNIKFPKLSEVSKSNNYAMSDYWLFDGSYFRVKNVRISYNLPKSIINKFRAKQVKVYLNISDLYSFNSYPKGWDPEVSHSGYPITTSIVIGAKVRF